MVTRSLLFILLIGITIIFSVPLVQAADKSAKKTPINHTLKGLLLNYDCTDFFYNNTPEQISGAGVDAQIELLADAGVTVFLCNTNAQRTNYASAAFEPFWQGYDPEGPDDQPFLADMPPESRANYRRMIASMRALHLQGVDYPARVIQTCRLRQISPWISLRMNDIHNTDRLQHPIHSTFWRENPQFWRVSDRQINYYDRALDYAHPEVRARYQALIQETLDRYDIDGLELDFMREPYLFEPGHEAAGGVILTDWLKTVRQLVRNAAKQRQHAIKLGVRVPAHPMTAHYLGLDVTRWAQLELIDLVVVTPRWSTLDNNLPLAIWKLLLAPYPLTLAGGLEIREQFYPGGPGRLTTPIVAFGAALNALYGGADVIYLFNYFPSMIKNGWSQEQYQHCLQTMTAFEQLAAEPRRHILTFRDVYVPGELFDAPLPATGKRLFFRLQTGPRPVNRTVTATIGLKVGAEVNVDSLELRINGNLCRMIAHENVIYRFEVPAKVLEDRVQLMEVATFNEQTITIDRAEMEIGGVENQ